MSERIPQALTEQLQAEQTPTETGFTPPRDSCFPRCNLDAHGAILEALVDDFKQMNADSHRRHAQVMKELSALKGTVVDQGRLLTKLALNQAATATLAGETASHLALSAEEAARRAPRGTSDPPPSKGARLSSKRTQGLLWALGVVLAGAGATLLERCTPPRLPVPATAAPQPHDGP